MTEYNSLRYNQPNDQIIEFLLLLYIPIREVRHWRNSEIRPPRWEVFLCLNSRNMKERQQIIQDYIYLAERNSISCERCPMLEITEGSFCSSPAGLSQDANGFLHCPKNGEIPRIISGPGLRKLPNDGNVKLDKPEIRNEELVEV